MGKLTRQDGQKKSTGDDVNAFLQKVAATPPPVAHSDSAARLIFALDATASREHTWHQARDIQAQMFSQADRLGGLDIQLCYYRGFDEFHASSWFRKPGELLVSMSGVHCLGGMTQIEKVLKHAIRETKRRQVKALVFVGDCMEENVDLLCRHAGELGVLGVRAFVFQEGNDLTAQRAFAQIAKLTGGAHCQFDANSADELRQLLSAVAAYAAGGAQALQSIANKGGNQAKRLAHQLGK